MVLNPGKYHYLIIDEDITSESIELGNKTLLAETEQKLPGIIIATDLNFRRHKKVVLKTTNQKLSTLIRVVPFRTDFNRKLINGGSFIKSQFNYCPYSGCLVQYL